MPRPNPRVEWRTFGAEAVLLDPQSGAYVQVNQAGLSIWTQVDGHRSIEDIAGALAEQVDAPGDELTDDVIEFLAELARHGLVLVDP